MKEETSHEANRSREFLLLCSFKLLRDAIPAVMPAIPGRE
jgi:hypothetical protein